MLINRDNLFISLNNNYKYDPTLKKLAENIQMD